jgi:signal transduction histidine kinase
LNDLDAVFSDALRARLLRRMGDAVQHDLKSPVQGLQWCLDLASGSVSALDPSDPSRQQVEKALAMARKELARIERNGRALLCDIGILEDEEARFDLAELARELARHFATEAAIRNAHLALSVPEDPVVVRGPRGEIRRAILTCIVTALDALPTGGRAAVAVRVEGDLAVVEVAVDGTPGSAARGDEGNGYSLANLGLRIARQNLEARGGALRSESRGPQSGRATCVMLPLA